MKSQEGSQDQSLDAVIATMKNNFSDYGVVVQSCKDLGKIDNESLEAVLLRQAAISCLLDAIKSYPEKPELHVEACRSLLQHIKESESSLHYLNLNNGVERICDLVKKNVDNVKLLVHILDIFSYLSSNEQLRVVLSEKISLTRFVTILSRHDSNLAVIEKCCLVVSNFAIPENLARELLKVGGVKSIVAIASKYTSNVDIVKHCCNALGAFAFHDNVCEAVVDAGATKAVLAVMTSHPKNAVVNESCNWALSCLARSDSARQEVIESGAFNALTKGMAAFPHQHSIQEYGCWALCHLAGAGSWLDDKDSHAALELLIQNLGLVSYNVELLEHVCFVISTLVATKLSLHGVVMSRGCVSRFIQLMRTYEENIHIRVNCIRVIANLAVNIDYRLRLEDSGASEMIIDSMLRHEKQLDMQIYGCIAMTNLVAGVMDNKFRIVKNGGVHAVLLAMGNNRDSETLQLSALKLLSNLLETDKGGWKIVDEDGVQFIVTALKTFPKSDDILIFGCHCLENIPRRGVDMSVLDTVEATFLDLKRSLPTNTVVARGLINFYENALYAGAEYRKQFSRRGIQKVLVVLQKFYDVQLHREGCKIIAQVALAGDVAFLSKDVLLQLFSSMSNFNMDVNVQIIGCGTLYYLSTTDEGLRRLAEVDCITTTLECMKAQQNIEEIQIVCMEIIKNIFKADMMHGKMLKSVFDVMCANMKAKHFQYAIQRDGCRVIAYIGRVILNENERRGQNVSRETAPKKRVTERILDVATRAIRRIEACKEEQLLEEIDQFSDKELEAIQYILALHDPV